MNEPSELDIKKWLLPVVERIPHPTYPSAVFPQKPVYDEMWHAKAEALRAEIAALQDQLDEAEEREIVYVDNPDFDQAVFDQYFPRVITVGQSYRP